jgi:hypothetical protein
VELALVAATGAADEVAGVLTATGAATVEAVLVPVLVLVLVLVAAAGGAELAAELPVDAAVLAVAWVLLTGTAGVASARQSSRARPNSCPACSRAPPAWRNAENKSCKNACKSVPSELAAVPLEPDEFVDLAKAGLGVLVAVLAVAAGEVVADEAVAAAAAGTVAVEVALDAAVAAAGAA